MGNGLLFQCQGDPRFLGSSRFSLGVAGEILQPEGDAIVRQAGPICCILLLLEQRELLGCCFLVKGTAPAQGKDMSRRSPALQGVVCTDRVANLGARVGQQNVSKVISGVVSTCF